jgi:hypothetical protein
LYNSLIINVCKFLKTTFFARIGMEFLGGPRELRVTRLPQLFRRQELEAAAAQDAFQPRFEAAQGLGGQVGEPPGAAVGVEQQVLRAIRGRFKVTPRLG